MHRHVVGAWVGRRREICLGEMIGVRRSGARRAKMEGLQENGEDGPLTLGEWLQVGGEMMSKERGVG